MENWWEKLRRQPPEDNTVIIFGIVVAGLVIVIMLACLLAYRRIASELKDETDSNIDYNLGLKPVDSNRIERQFSEKDDPHTPMRFRR